MKVTSAPTWALAATWARFPATPTVVVVVEDVEDDVVVEVPGGETEVVVVEELDVVEVEPPETAVGVGPAADGDVVVEPTRPTAAAWVVVGPVETARAARGAAELPAVPPRSPDAATMIPITAACRPRLSCTFQ
jgi:hypothetical protein